MKPFSTLSQTFFGLLSWQLGRPSGIISDPSILSQQTFDYIVVGGGTAGLIVASRLAENPDITVGVIEAGEAIRDDPNVDMLINYGLALGNSSYDWAYTSVPQESLDGRVVGESTGKLLGGSSGICDVLWQRSSAIDYDVWAKDLKNGETWTFKGLLPYFKKAESWSQPVVRLPDEEFSAELLKAHNHDGPVKVGYNNFVPEPIFPYVEAANKLGIPTNSNPDTGNPIGILGPARALNPETGKRSYTLNSYIDPNSDRSNLLILTGALATKLVFDEPTDGVVSANGVEFVSQNATFIARASKEVILAAGAFKTPQILELSGIGRKSLLDEMNIQTVVDLPGVGENLIDQTAILMDYKTTGEVRTLDQLRLNQTFLQEQGARFAKDHTGVLTYDTPAVAHVPLKTTFDTKTISSLKKLFEEYVQKESHTGLQKAQYDILRSFFDSDEAAWLEFLLFSGGGYASPPEGEATYLTPFSFHLHPLSRGTVHITSSDPLAGPSIDPRYFHSDFDVRMSALSAEYMRKWMGTAPLSDILVGPNSPPAEVAKADDFESYVRQVMMSTSHPIGTASMAPKEWGGVVSPELKVYGTSNLRVVDASIQPLTIGVAPLATVYAIAEKAADIIKGVKAE